MSFPTAMTFDEEGDLFVSNKGFGQPTNIAGEIVKVSLGATTRLTVDLRGGYARCGSQGNDDGSSRTAPRAEVVG